MKRIFFILLLIPITVCSQVAPKIIIEKNYAAPGIIPPYSHGNLMLVGFDGYTAFTTANVATGTLWAFPVFERAGEIITSVAIRRNGQTFNARAGIYSDSLVHRVPYKLLADLGEINVAAGSTSLNYWTASPLPYKIPATGIYWYVVTVDGIAGLKTILTANSPVLGYDDPHTLNPDVTQIACMSAPFSYATLPELFPDSLSVLLINSALFIPAVFKTYGVK